MRAVVYQHERDEDLALFAQPLVRAGFALESRYWAPDPQDAGADLLVVLGGMMAVYERHLHPFLDDEIAVLRRRLATGRPTLAICLGSQLLAQAAGARVFKGERGEELGTTPLTLTPDGAADPILSEHDGLRVAHWHGDTFSAVPGAPLLASTPSYPQVFRIGDSYGFQCHIELDAPLFQAWLQRWERSTEGFPPLVAAPLERLRESLASHFAAACQGRS